MSMKKIIYISLKEKIITETCSVKVSDIANIYCNDEKIAEKAEKIEILQFNKSPNKAVISITEIIRDIEEDISNVDIVNLDSTNVVIQYKEKKKDKKAFLEIMKIIFVCLIVFFGAAFAIMSFNEDVSTKSLFENVYMMFTGEKSNGHTIIEASYSVGLGLGIIVLYGHFWKIKLTNDPTPIEVEMNKYEKDINATIISEYEKEEE